MTSLDDLIKQKLRRMIDNDPAWKQDAMLRDIREHQLSARIAGRFRLDQKEARQAVRELNFTRVNRFKIRR